MFLDFFFQTPKGRWIKAFGVFLFFEKHKYNHEKA